MNAAQETIEAMEAELHQEVYRELVVVRDYAKTYDPADIDDGDGPCIDVRLQVLDDGAWTVRAGDSSYDQDHSGYWGCSAVSPDDDEQELIQTARNLVEQVLDHVACQ